MSFKNRILVVAFILPFVTGCKKLVDIEAPITGINQANIYSNDVTAAAVLTGIYGTMSANEIPTGGITSASFFLGLSADEFTLYSGVGNPIYTQFYQNALLPSTDIALWSKLYAQIFTANTAIEGLTQSSGLTLTVKQQLLGEAKFFRAFCYSYLVSLYGDVPLTLNTDYSVNAKLARVPQSQVWQQIISDLKDAQGLLSAGYVKSDAMTIYPNASAERVRPNKWAATALLARVYLFLGDYVNAEAQSTAVINQTSLFSLQPLNSIFLKNSLEAIWQLQPVASGYNTQDARVFIIPASGPSPSYPIYISHNLIASFEAGDARTAAWIGKVTVSGATYPYPNKYKVAMSGAPVTEYLMVLRLAEQYLIRAEARAQQGNTTGAAADLNTIRARANLANTTAGTPASQVAAVLHERQVELFSEWGHRWLDLKRTKQADAVMSSVTPQKGHVWKSYQQLYPIPLAELQLDPNLIQNSGY